MRIMNNTDDNAQQAIDDLIRTDFAARDTLYAAANALDDDQLAEICRRLADDLGGHAAELLQFTHAQHNPAETADSVEMRLDTATFQLLSQRRGQAAILAQAEAHEQEVKAKYDEVIRALKRSELKRVLLQQREKTQFGVSVLRSIRRVREGSEK